MKKLFRGSFRIITAVIVMMTVLFVCSYSVVESQAQEYTGTIIDTPKYASYTLSYSANGGSGAPSSQSGYSSYTISSVVPTRFGYTFLGWSTSSSASSASYSPGNSISLSSSRTLYAVWQTATSMSANSSYTAYINFSEQERYYSFTPSSSGSYIFQSTGSLDSKIYVYNSSGSLIGSDDDEGADYNFLLQLSLTSGTKYYVKVRAYSSGTGSTSFSVKPVSCNLSYNANGGSGAPATQTGASSYTINSTIPSKMGYTFLGWSKSSSASSASYVPGNTISLTSATTLYAVWKSATTISTNSSYTASVSFVGQEVYYSFTPSSTISYTFESTASFDTVIYVYNSSGSQIDYNDDGGSNRNFRLTLTLTSGTKYYVKVRAYSSGTGSIPFTVRSASTYTLTYNANGGSGAPSSQTGASSYTISSTVPVKFGYTFLGWSKSSTATSASYTSGNTISLTANTTLYAVWQSNVTVLSVNSSGSASVTSSKKIVYYEFTPSTTATYVIYSTGSVDTKVVLYNSSGTQLATDDDSGDNNNFLLRYNMTAGNRYVYAVQYYNSSNTGTISFKFGRTYTVSYNANGGSGAPSSQYRDYGKTLTLSSTVPTYSGKSFLGWAKSSSSTTVAYQPSASFSENSDVTLYAVWSQGYNLSYNANGGSGAPANQTGATSYTISSTLPTRFGYTFLGWAKSSTATSATYTPGNSISVTSATTLYAVWKSPVVMSLNSAYTASVSFSNQEHFYTFTPSTSGNYIFESTGSVDSMVYLYNSSGSQLGSDDQSGDGNNFKLQYNLTSGNKYYVKVRGYSTTTGSISFSVKTSTYTLTYDANGGSGAPSAQTGARSYTISAAQPTRTGYTFLGWAKSSTSSAAYYTSGNSISLTENTTLYAVWAANTYTVRYNSNGGTGTMANSTHTYDVAKTLTPNAYQKTDRVFLGWSTSISSSVVTYADGQSVMNLTSVNGTIIDLYAVWHNHSYTSSVTTPATCTTSGVMTFTCSGCSHSYTQTILSTGHVWVDGNCTVPRTCSVCNATDGTAPGHDYISYVSKSPSCDETGSEVRTCSVCQYTWTETIPALGHSWTAATCTTMKQCSTCGATEGEALGHSWTDATCTKKQTCSVCGVTTGEPLGHDYSSTVTTDPTCTQQGVKTFSCSRCTSTYTEPIPETGHSWTDATCTVPKICSNCNDTQENALGHDYDSEITEPATCTTAGTQTYDCSRCSHSYEESIPATGHSWAVATCTAPKTCSVCMDTQGSALGHDYDSEITEPAACTTDGTMLYDCSRCYHYYTEAIPATGHNPGIATCTEPSTCSACGIVTGNALGHNYTSTVITESSCTEDGVTLHECSRCSYSYTEDIVATGHDWLSATCDLPKRCSVCALTEGNSLGHVFESQVITYATCTESGEKLYTCFECGVSHSEIIPPVGHNEQFIEGTPETCTESGLTNSSVCSECGIVIVEQLVIPARGHDYISVVTAPTCTVQGFTTHTCACGDSYDDTYVDATGHPFGEWRETKSPTYRQDGEKVRECSVCGEIQTRVIDKLAAQQEISDSATGIIVRLMFSSFNGDVALNVNVITEGQHYDILDRDKSDYRKQMFDVTTLVGGEDAQPNGLILVGIPVPENYNHDGTVIYFINEDGSGYVKADTFYRNGYLWIETDHIGVYAIVDESEKIERPVEPEYVLGDANGDGKVTAADARTVLRASARIDTLEGTLFLAADVNSDTKITASDARKILRVSAKIETF